jgi:hypothetical protein
MEFEIVWQKKVEFLVEIGEKRIYRRRALWPYRQGQKRHQERSKEVGTDGTDRPCRHRLQAAILREPQSMTFQEQ